MNARHIEERIGTMMIGGKEVEFTYHVTVVEPCPPPTDINPYGEEGRCTAKLGTPTCTLVPAPVVEKRVPSKAEYIRSFARAGALPQCVGETVAGNLAFVRKARDWFGGYRDTMPRRLRRAIARLDLANLVTHYDTGAFGRVSHYLYDHQGRVFVASVLS